MEKGKKTLQRRGGLIDKGSFSENISFFFILRERKDEREEEGSGRGQSIKVETD
jgi:hypothetical protein